MTHTHTMTNLRVNELFYSLQGEGARAGEPSIFIRLAGCDLACGFCDTEFESGVEMTPDDLLAKAKDVGGPCKWLIFTGGEPMLQLTSAHVLHFQEAGYKVACESNGNHPIPEEIDWKVISPKVAEHVLKKHNPNGCDELRYVRHVNQLAIPEPAIRAKRYFLSPQFKGDRPDPAAIEHCKRLCMENPHWSVSIQMHKLWRIL